MNEWLANPSPQPGQPTHATVDGLYATVDKGVLYVGRVDRVPTVPEVKSAVDRFVPAGIEVSAFFPLAPGANLTANTAVVRWDVAAREASVPEVPPVPAVGTPSPAFGPTMLTEHFSLDEFTASATAKARGIANVPGPAEIQALQSLALNVLEPTRRSLGPLYVLSGFRSAALNAAVGGAQESQHRVGEAADVASRTIPTASLFAWMRANVPFDQLILEMVDPKNPFKGWVHVSYRAGGNQRREVLAASVGPGGKTVYQRLA